MTLPADVLHEDAGMQDLKKVGTVIRRGDRVLRLQLMSPNKAQLMEAHVFGALSAEVQSGLIRVVQRHRFTAAYCKSGQVVFMRRDNQNVGRATVSLLTKGMSCTAEDCLVGWRSM